MLLALLIGSTAGQLIYQVDFEKGSCAAEIGTSRLETGTSDTTKHGTILAVDNPAPSMANNSSKVGRCQTPSGYVRAELSSQRLPVVGKTYIYKWSYYFPTDFFLNDSLKWLLITQFKTYPCGQSLFPQQICGNGGIFNEISLTSSRNMVLHFRAQPDCYYDTTSLKTGQWISFVMEIKWTKSDSGYCVVFVDHQKTFEQHDFKTLYDSLSENGSCNMYWSVGMYASWFGTRDSLAFFIDNLEIWKKTQDITLCDVCPECCESTSVRHQITETRPSQLNLVRFSAITNAITLDMSLTKPSVIQLALYNATGRRMALFSPHTTYSAGKQRIQWTIPNAGSWPSGIYLLRLTTNSGNSMQAMVVTR